MPQHREEQAESMEFRRKILASLIAAIVLTAGIGAAQAHPHVWVDTRSTVLFNDEGAMTGVYHRWTFDELFSAYASQGLDTDGDGVLTREELQPLAEVNVESLHEFDYFTFLDIGDGYARFIDPVDYWLESDGMRLTLHFTLPLDEPMMMDARRVSIQVYDPSFFVDFTPAETEAARMANAPAICELEVEEAEPLDPVIAMRLAQIPADIRDLPPELLAFTADNPNAIHVICR
jgi:ABC-type uncharacterized transport system substrate-binding protein